MVNSAAMNLGLHVSFQSRAFTFFEMSAQQRSFRLPWGLRIWSAAAVPTPTRPQGGLAPSSICYWNGRACKESILCLCIFCFTNKQTFCTQSIHLGINTFFFFFFFDLLAISWAAPVASGGSQARGPIGAAAAHLRHSHSHARSKPCLPPTAQLTATPDPQPPEQGQGSNPQPHGS